MRFVSVYVCYAEWHEEPSSVVSEWEQHAGFCCTTFPPLFSICLLSASQLSCSAGAALFPASIVGYFPSPPRQFEDVTGSHQRPPPPTGVEEPCRLDLIITRKSTDADSSCSSSWIWSFVSYYTAVYAQAFLSRYEMR